jgi:ABC-2 type transport system permease protein
LNNFAALFIGILARSKGILITSILVSLGIAALGIGIVNASGTAAEDIKLGFIDRDGSAVSADFARYLEDDLGIVLVRSDDVDEMNTSLVDKHISGIVEIPKGFETGLLSDSAKPALLTFMDDYANAAFTRGYIESYVQSLASSTMVSGGDTAELGLLLEQTAENRVSVAVTEKDDALVRAQADRNAYNLMISFLMMFSFIMTISIASMLHSDRMAGTYRRIKAGRVTSLEYVSSVTGVGILMMVLINGPALVLHALTGSDPGVPYAVTIGLVFVYSLFVVAFGLLIGLVMRTNNGLIAVIIAVTTITSMLGGAFFPIGLAPRLFQVLGYVTPQHWFFRAVSAWQEGAGAGGAIGPVLIITLAAVLCFVLSGIQFTTNKSLARV